MALPCLLVLLTSVLLVFAGPDPYHFSIVENSGTEQLVGVIESGANHQYSFIGPRMMNCDMFFMISTNGRITTRNDIDREDFEHEVGSDEVECIVSYEHQSTVVHIQVLDLNDNDPRFNDLAQVERRTIEVSVPIHQQIVRLEPVDNDKGENGTTTFEITDGNSAGLFDIQILPIALGDLDRTVSFLVVAQELGAGSANMEFNLTITIRDMGIEQRSFDQQIIVDVTESPDEPPTFAVTSIMFQVHENHPVGKDKSIGNVTAVNVMNVQGDIIYSVGPANDEAAINYVNISERTGMLYLTQPLDYETQQMLEFYIYATNSMNSAQDFVFTTIEVIDVNDNIPFCNTDQPMVMNLEENSNTVFSRSLVIRDNDRSTEFRRISTNVEIVASDTSLQDGIDAVGFEVGFISFRINKTLDRERTPNFTIELTFYNDAEPRLSGTCLVSINVLDVNDNTPHFVVNHTRVAEGSPIGKEVLTRLAVDEDAGRNGTITYALERVDPPLAQGWFDLSPSTGIISIASNDIAHTESNGRVLLTISATDNSDERLSSVTQVTVEISPTLTFLLSSYAQYDHLDRELVNNNEYTLYLELRTKQAEGIVLFQQGEAGNIVLLELTEGHLRFQHGVSITNSSELVVSNNEWYSVLLVRRQNQISLQVWETEHATQAEKRMQILTEATLFGCDSPGNLSPVESSLFIGGVNPFLLDDSVNLRSTEFVGVIRNVVINQRQIDMGCPTNKENVVEGFHDSSTDTCNTAPCENEHTVGCVDIVPEPYCKCLGGFPPASCQPIANPDQNIEGADDSYAPIRFHGNSKANLRLDFSFFSDLLMLRTRAANIESSSNRRRKRDSTQNSQLNNTVQTVEISFKLVDIQPSVLLHSRTSTTVHTIEIHKVDENHAIIYSANDADSNVERVNILRPLQLQNMTLYKIRLEITEDFAIMSINGSETRKQWTNRGFAPFVEQPSTVLTIGGSENDDGFFKGCMRRIAIDSIELPLTGLLEHGGFMTSSTAPDKYCDLCDLTNCPDSYECVGNAVGDSTCLVIPTIVPTSAILSLSSITPFIIGGSVGAVLLIIVVVLVIVLVQCCYRKRDQQKRTYSVSNININDFPTANSASRSNEYVHMQSTRDNALTPTTDNSRCDRGSSVSTFQEHAEDGDPEIETLQHFKRRKSTISAESGIRTDTEREVSLRSIPQMDESGNEKETDFSDGESASDDLSSTCFVQSPIAIQLVSSSNSITAIHSTVSSPNTLTPKERRMITPLRPPSTALSASEYEDAHHHGDEDTDVEVSYPYSHHTLPSSLSRNSSTRRSGRHRSEGGEISRVSSACSGVNWYKASTASDTEREKERTRANRAFYPQHSEPGTYPVPPKYPSPPSFKPKNEDKSMLYPNTRRSRMPINIAESPLSRNKKHEEYQFPYEHSRAQDPRLRYDNHRLKHQYSLPKGHPSIALSSTSSSSGRPRHNAEAMLASGYPHSPPPAIPHYPRHFSIPGQGSSMPHHTVHYQYLRSYSSEDKSKKEPEQKFQDLKSVSTINPISYWEMQDRMNKTAVDQVDPYQILSEPYVQFEDVSTDPSVIESQITQDGPEHQHFCSQGGGERPAGVLPPQLSESELQDDSTIVTDTDLGTPMPVFPSADCSPYTATLVASTSGSSSSTPKTPNVFTLTSSQHQFDV